MSDLLIEVNMKSWDVTSLSHGLLISPHWNDAQRSIIQKVFERDAYTCQYCGWQDEQYQEIHHLNHDHEDMRLENLVTSCTMCHRNFHINMLMLHRAAHLIYLPEISQIELNTMLKALFSAQYHSRLNPSNNNYKYAFDLIFENMLLGNRAALATNIFRYKDVSPMAQLAQILIDLQRESPTEYKNRHTWLKDFRLLHTPESMAVQVAHWAGLMDKQQVGFLSWDNYGASFLSRVEKSNL